MAKSKSRKAPAAKGRKTRQGGGSKEGTSAAGKSRKQARGAARKGRTAAVARQPADVRRGPALEGAATGPPPELVARARQVDARLATARPEPQVELDHTSALELLVATTLAAQCTDERVNQVTARLFTKYPRPADYVAVPLEELEEDIRTTGFFRQKARSLRGIMEDLEARFGGEVPGDMASLTSLPGVGRKTANVVLAHSFGVPGLVVDTHVTRLAARLGLTSRKDADKIEADLCALLPPERWSDFGTRLVLHGRYVCRARQPQCDLCPLRDLCPHYQGQETADG